MRSRMTSGSARPSQMKAPTTTSIAPSDKMATRPLTEERKGMVEREYAKRLVRSEGFGLGGDIWGRTADDHIALVPESVVEEWNARLLSQNEMYQLNLKVRHTKSYLSAPLLCICDGYRPVMHARAS